jgi:hypothetical protein
MQAKGRFFFSSFESRAKGRLRQRAYGEHKYYQACRLGNHGYEIPRRFFFSNLDAVA